MENLCLRPWNYSWPSVSRGFLIWGFKQLSVGNIWKKITETSKKQNLNLPHTGNNLHSTYIVLSIISNLEVTKFERMCIGYMQINTLTFYIKDFSIHGFFYPCWVWGQSPADTEGCSILRCHFEWWPENVIILYPFYHNLYLGRPSICALRHKLARKNWILPDTFFSHVRERNLFQQRFWS